MEIEMSVNGSESESDTFFGDGGLRPFDEYGNFSDNDGLGGNRTLLVTDYTWEECFRDASRFWVQRVLVPIVVCIGVLGNLITIFILTRRPMRSSTNVYLTALAVSDFFFLLFTFSMSLTHYPSFDSYWFYWSYKPFGLWLADAASSTSVWLTVSFTIERYIAVCHPMRGKVLCTEERAIKVAILVYVICFAVTSPTPFEWKLENETNADNATIYKLAYSDFGNDETYQKLFYWFSSIMFVILPVFILAILNFILIQAVRRSRILRKQMTQNLQSTSVRQMQTMRQENRITITLIGVVIVFLLCQVPTALVLIYVSFYPEPSRREGALLRAFGNIFNLLVALNAACNFLLYTAFSDKYRKYFCAFLFCWRKRGRRGQQPAYYDHSNLYDVDTMNTTLSLSRATSLRVNSSPTRNQAGGGGGAHAGGGGGGGVNYNSNYLSVGGAGLRRSQTCASPDMPNARQNLKNGKHGANEGQGLRVNSSGNSPSFKNNFLGGCGGKGGLSSQSSANSINSSRGIHINLKDSTIPLIQVDQV